MLAKLGIAAAVIVAGGCSFEASCGTGKELRMDKAKDFLRAAVEDDVGVAPTGIDCPEDVPIEQGRVTVCKVTVGGVVGEFEIVQQDDDGTITLGDARGLIVAAKLEALITDQLEAKLGARAEVDCGEPVRAAIPGSSFECTARDAQGVTAPVAVTVKDELGNVSYDVVMPPAAATPKAEPTPVPVLPP